jgi:hypothetical protein
MPVCHLHPVVELGLQISVLEAAGVTTPTSAPATVKGAQKDPQGQTPAAYSSAAHVLDPANGTSKATIRFNLYRVNSYLSALQGSSMDSCLTHSDVS